MLLKYRDHHVNKEGRYRLKLILIHSRTDALDRDLQTLSICVVIFPKLHLEEQKLFKRHGKLDNFPGELM